MILLIDNKAMMICSKPKVNLTSMPRLNVFAYTTMNSTSIIHNPHNLPAAGQIIEWLGNRPFRIRLAMGLTLRLSPATGLYVPE